MACPGCPGRPDTQGEERDVNETITLVPFNATPENWCAMHRGPIAERTAYSDTEWVMCAGCARHCADCADETCDHPKVRVSA